MDTKAAFLPKAGDKIVYIRPMQVEALPPELQAQIGPLKTVYAVHDEEGAQLAVVKDQHMAFVLARQNDCAPVHVH